MQHVSHIQNVVTASEQLLLAKQVDAQTAAYNQEGYSSIMSSVDFFVWQLVETVSVIRQSP